MMYDLSEAVIFQMFYTIGKYYFPTVSLSHLIGWQTLLRQHLLLQISAVPRSLPSHEMRQSWYLSSSSTEAWAQMKTHSFIHFGILLIQAPLSRLYCNNTPSLARACTLSPMHCWTDVSQTWTASPQGFDPYKGLKVHTKSNIFGYNMYLYVIGI